MMGRAALVAGLLEACYAAVLLPVFVLALVRATASIQRARKSAAIRPVIREALVEYMAGNPNAEQLREFSQMHRTDLVECVLEFRGAVGGGARERLWELGMELSLVHDWCQETRSKDRRIRAAAFERLAHACAFEPCRRVAGELQLAGIEDPDPAVRLAAARGLAQSDDVADAERAFAFALEQDLLGRILLTEPLRRHAVTLCDRALPDVLRSGKENRVLIALDMLIAWGRAVPLTELAGLVTQGSSRVRLQALRAMPLCAASRSNREAVLKALEHEDPAIARGAILAAGRMRITEARETLERWREWGVPEVAHAASEALATIVALPVEGVIPV